MDLAYDHITEESLPQDEEGRDHGRDSGSGGGSSSGGGSGEPGQAGGGSTLNADLQAAYTALSASASPWASRIGGFFGSVVKQGESVYREAQQEVTALGQDASKSLTGLRDTLVSRTRGLSVTGTAAAPTGDATTESAAAEAAASASASAAATTSTAEAGSGEGAAGEDEATVLARIKGEAAKRLRDLQRAEDAADEALIKLGTNLRDFLRDAIQIAPPTGAGAGASGGSGSGSGQGRGSSDGGSGGGGSSTVLFESKDAQGRRVIHRSRFDAQLHVIHTNVNSFTKEPSSGGSGGSSGDAFAAWARSFDVASKTDDIAADLQKYPELRTTMETLVPATIAYADFWTRYYFLRHGIETAEARRRDLLRAASAEEEIAWDEDSEEGEGEGDEDSDAGTAAGKKSTASSTTIHQPPAAAAAASTPAAAEASKGAGAGAGRTLKPLASPSPRKSDEKSQADSEASYDMVGAKSGAPSQAPNSPKRVDEDSEEEDWE